MDQHGAADGFVQLLNPEGDHVDSVTGPDGVTYAVDFIWPATPSPRAPRSGG
ncbi:hypothetical protein [Actinoplanes philippinensis]|uniref:hypothetical protein n=1 Tax=Actinoplanes philippinensis TaxID=35752 RepID=UPI0033C89F71